MGAPSPEGGAMTLHLVPTGRGRWRTVVLQVSGDRASPLLVRIGDRIPLGGVLFRVSKVSA